MLHMRNIMKLRYVLSYFIHNLRSSYRIGLHYSHRKVTIKVQLAEIESWSIGDIISEEVKMSLMTTQYDTIFCLVSIIPYHLYILKELYKATMASSLMFRTAITPPYPYQQKRDGLCI